MKLAVILVNYNTRALLRQALKSVAASARASGLDGDDVSVVVVDNASNDGSAAMVAGEFPQVRLMPLADNAGFTRANNLALEELGFAVSPASTASSDRPDYVLLLNPDAELVDDALGRMVGFMDTHPAVGACGPRLAYGDGSFQHGAFAFPGLGQVALDLFPVDWLPGAARLYGGGANGRYQLTQWEGETPFRVDFVLGAAMMMRGAAIERIGGLDEGFFMYCEEMDWCLRLAQAGMDVCAVPAARVTHHEGQSSRQTPWPSFRNLWRSRIRFYAKHRRCFAPGHLLCVRLLLRTAMRLRGRQARRRFAHGQSTGTETANALAAYAYVARL